MTKDYFLSFFSGHDAEYRQTRRAIDKSLTTTTRWPKTWIMYSQNPADQSSTTRGSSAFEGFVHLLSTGWFSFKNAPRSQDGARRLPLVFFGTLGLLFMFGAGWGSHWLFSQFLQTEFLADLLIRRVVDLILVFFFGLLIFSNTIAGFSVLYFADEMPGLVSAPLPVGRLFMARLVQCWGQSSWMMFVFAVPMLMALGPVLKSPWWFYTLTPFVLLPMTIMCAGIGACITMVLARFLPAKRTRDGLIVLGIVGFLVIYIAFRVAEPERFLEPDGFKDLVSLIGSLQSGESPLIPTSWVLTLIIGLAKGELTALIEPVVLLLSGTFAACTLGVWLARATFLESFSTAQEGISSGGSSGRTSDSKIVNAVYVGKSTDAIARRDTRIFLRTASQWTQLLLVGALIIVYLFNFKHFRALQETKIISSIGIFYLNFALSGLVVSTLAARFLYPSVSLEGKAFWALQVAPIDGGTIVRGKLKWGLIPAIAVALILAVGSGLITGLSGWLVVNSMILAFICTFAVSGMAVGLGAAWPQFHLDNPTRIASGMGGVLFMLLALTYLLAAGILSAWPLIVLRQVIEGAAAPSAQRLVMAAASFSGLMAISSAVYLIPMRLGARRLTDGPQ